MTSLLMRDFFESSYYKLLLQEKEEIERLKWIESEKKGCDIGLTYAIYRWCRFHRGEWLKEQRKKHEK